MVAIVHAFVCALFVVGSGVSLADDSVQLSESFGGDHGVEFSDQALVTAGQTVESITLWANKRVDGVALEVKRPTAATFQHGGTDGSPLTLTLGDEEYITSMEAHWDVKNGYVRVFYVKFRTSAGNFIAGGSQAGNKQSVTAPEGFELGGFFGRYGDGINKLGAIWTRISAKAPGLADPARAPEVEAGSNDSCATSTTGPTGNCSKSATDEAAGASSGSALDVSSEQVAMISIPGSAFGSTEDGDVTLPTEDASNEGSLPEAINDPAAASADSGSASVPASLSPTLQAEALIMNVKDSIQQSEVFGGPHGMDFSDRNFVYSGQKVSQISIYAGERLDGISLAITSPKAHTFTHGGTGGAQQELKLDDGEYIKSMEVHWGKKSGQTRIFYVAFTTSAGKTLSGGSETNDKGTVTAPEGFQLAGFYGSDGKEIDRLGAIWASIDLVTPAPTPAPAPVTNEDSPGTVAPADLAGSLSEVALIENKRPVQLSDSFGGPHGEQFSDALACTSGMVITSVTIRAGERLDGLVVHVAAPREMTFQHGGNGGTEHTLVLEPGEYITTMEVHVGQRKGRTRIFYISLTTSNSNTVSGGSQTIEKASLVAPKGYQLSGFFGRYGDEMDRIGAVWSSIAAINETTSSLVALNEDIALGELYGGPHGNAFSDIENVRFGQKIESIAIGSKERLDSVMLKLAFPEKIIMKHGGRGGTEKALTLATDEYITSMEVHWDKKDDRTCVFYIAFTTTAGQSLSGGTKTDKFRTATAPEGYVLGGFYGRAAGEVDQIGAIWINKTAKDVMLTDPSGVGNGTYGTTIRNWVGPNIGKPTDKACYRKITPYDSNTICPLGYGKQDVDCMTRCPLSYPVTCGVECMSQNDDCALMVLDKIGSVLLVAANAASFNVIGSISSAYKTTKRVIMCTTHIIGVIQSLLFYLRYRQATAPIGESAELLTMAYQADVVIFDLPIAVCVCLNLPIPKAAQYSDYVLVIVEGIVKAVVTQGDEIISTGANVMNLLMGNGLANDSTTTTEELEDLVKRNSTCGWELKRLTDRVTRAVLRYRNAGDSLSDVRVKVYRSSIVLNDIPIVTNNCMGELLSTKTRLIAFETRDLLRKTFGVIVDQLIDTGHTDKGKDVAEEDYRLKVANMGLLALSAIDPTGIAYMAAQFVQPICGPTAYVGEIDDGTLYNALGLKTVDEAFTGTYGFYTHEGDGAIQVIFESVDTSDVTVVVYSGGDEYAKIDIGAGDVTTWDATFPELEDKTLYLDRWRPGIFGLPGKGGGSLLMWVPRSSLGGHITMHVRINPS